MNDTETEKLEIGVRYCGGCNPVYDRVAAVRRLQKLLPDISFVNAQPGTSYTAALIVCGCSTACAKTADLAVPYDRQIPVGGFADLLPARDRIQALLAQEDILTLNRNQIEELLPHRPPMLFVDCVTRLIPGKEAAGELFLDPSWECFKGHFPEEPVFPGVLALEAMAQTADLMAMTQDCFRNKKPLLMEMGHIRFLRPMYPGMCISLHAVLLEERRDLGVVISRCQALHEGKVCAQAQITIAMR